MVCPSIFRLILLIGVYPYQSGLTESGSGLILFSVIQMVYTRLTGCELNPIISDIIESTRANLAPIIGHALVTLKQN